MWVSYLYELLAAIRARFIAPTFAMCPGAQLAWPRFFLSLVLTAAATAPQGGAWCHNHNTPWACIPDARAARR